MMVKESSNDQDTNTTRVAKAGLKKKKAGFRSRSPMQLFRSLRSSTAPEDTTISIKMSQNSGIRDSMAAAHPQLVNGTVKMSADELSRYTKDNLHSWDAMAEHWEIFQSPADANGKTEDGNDMFTQCLLPVVDELVEWEAGQTVLDLGAGSGIIARRFASQGAHVIGLDYSEPMLQKGRERSKVEKLKGSVTYDFIDLMDYDLMAQYMKDRNNEKFDIITISTTLKSLPDLEPIARALPLMLAPGGRVVIVDLHPVFSKPAGHRGMEIYENPATGKQQLDTYIKVPKYLNIPPTLSEAVRGQPEPLWVFHRPFHSLLAPFFNNKLVLDAMREPAFKGDPVPSQAQSYHNFQQTPMLLAFRLRHMA